MNLTTDQDILWQHGSVNLNGTVVTTWAMMAVMALGAKLITGRLKTGAVISRWQASMEIVITGI